MKAPDVRWLESFAGAVTVTDREGIILAMNPAAQRYYGAFGGAKLIGTQVLDCHPEPSRSRVAGMLASLPVHNVYATEKAGQRRLVVHTTWYENGVAAGLVEMILDLPAELPLFSRD